MRVLPARYRPIRQPITRSIGGHDAQPPKRPQPPAFGMTHIVPLDNFPDHFDTQGRVLPDKQDDLLAKLFGLTGDPVLNAATAPGTGVVQHGPADLWLQTDPANHFSSQVPHPHGPYFNGLMVLFTNTDTPTATRYDQSGIPAMPNKADRVDPLLAFILAEHQQGWVRFYA